MNFHVCTRPVVEVMVGAEKCPRLEAVATPGAGGFAADWIVATQDAGEYPDVVLKST